MAKSIKSNNINIKSKVDSGLKEISRSLSKSKKKKIMNLKEKEKLIIKEDQLINDNYFEMENNRREELLLKREFFLNEKKKNFDKMLSLHEEIIKKGILKNRNFFNNEDIFNINNSLNKKHSVIDSLYDISQQKNSKVSFLCIMNNGFNDRVLYNPYYNKGFTMCSSLNQVEIRNDVNKILISSHQNSFSYNNFHQIKIFDEKKLIPEKINTLDSLSNEYNHSQNMNIILNDKNENKENDEKPKETKTKRTKKTTKRKKEEKESGYNLNLFGTIKEALSNIKESIFNDVQIENEELTCNLNEEIGKNECQLEIIEEDKPKKEYKTKNNKRRKKEESNGYISTSVGTNDDGLSIMSKESNISIMNEINNINDEIEEENKENKKKKKRNKKYN
jgi:hypothetical protein